MPKKRAINILTIIFLITFICGALSGILVLKLSKENPQNILQTIFNINNKEQDTLSSAITNLEPAVVVIEAYANNELISSGTGFVYRKDPKKAYIITNHHVIDAADKNNIKVILNDKTTLDTEFMESDPYTDIAVLTVDANKIKKVAVIGDISKLKIGDTLFTLGSPEGANYNGTVTKGILSGKNRLVSISLNNTDQNDYYMKLFQTDAAINPGNSGGPICNINGEVIGVTNMKLVSYDIETQNFPTKLTKANIEGMGFAIPIDDALKVASVLENKTKIKRPYIGIAMCNTNDTKNLFNSQILLDKSITSGVVILEIEKNSPAANAKLQIGDVIIELEGEKITDIAYLKYILHQHKPDETIKIKYLRDGQEKTTKIKLTQTKE